MLGGCGVVVLVGRWGVLARFVCVEASLSRGRARFGGCPGLGCFGWSGSYAWPVFTEPVTEGDAGALVV